MRRVSKGELLLALIFVVVGALWIFRASRMQLWDGFAPSSGFLPLVYGILLAGLALATAVQTLFDKAAPRSADLRKPVWVMAVLIAAVATLPVAGFVVAVFILLLFLYAAIERLPLLRAGMAAAAITAALYLIFKVWLGVPLPAFPA
jgi:Tripartite tricarboxylate transporter TctB family